MYHAVSASGTYLFFLSPIDAVESIVNKRIVVIVSSSALVSILTSALKV